MLRKKKRLIVLTGVDGSGKTTLIKRVSSQLQQQDVRLQIVWCGFRPFLTLPIIRIAKLIMLRRHDKFADYKGHREARNRGMKRAKFANGVLLFILMLDYYPVIFVRVIIPVLMGRTVICDRYYFDILLYYSVITNQKTEYLSELVQKLSFLFPNPELCFFIKITPEEAIRRKEDVPSTEYIAERIMYYEQMLKVVDCRCLDGEESVDNNTNKIISEINRADNHE
ncbi:MAG: hypothetical protein OEZ01_00345 [Candidatus Heimdallarchaeota archaeon]|nr:hypothetical protein [Candidatus Heimdallarchaeota archaeon]